MEIYLFFLKQMLRRYSKKCKVLFLNDIKYIQGN